ncbi:MAG: hypothetical protein CVU59_08245 [Deltaproteobacteria bacterium HGW-Deltaproteobacteria-17]|nr:MAG: hypothetical protein CVU59_08245 [Deltaproteobacteria bacterium HGW-Deltaproteobacteria-17]
MNKATKTLIAVLSMMLFHSEAYAAGLFCPNPTENDQDNKDVARKYFQMGLGYSEQADHRKCIEAFECVLKLIPYSTSARYQLAKALDDGGQYTRAKKEYKLFLTTADKADPLRQKVQERLAAIETLADKPLPPEAGEVAVEKVKEDLREELNRKLAELQKANKAADELEKEKARLQEEYKKKEAEKLAELNEKIREVTQAKHADSPDIGKTIPPVSAPGHRRKAPYDQLVFAGLGFTNHDAVYTFNQDLDLVSKTLFPSGLVGVDFFLSRRNSLGFHLQFDLMPVRARLEGQGTDARSYWGSNFLLMPKYSFWSGAVGSTNRLYLQGAVGLSYLTGSAKYYNASLNEGVGLDYNLLQIVVQVSAGWMVRLTPKLHLALQVQYRMELNGNDETSHLGVLAMAVFPF